MPLCLSNGWFLLHSPKYCITQQMVFMLVHWFLCFHKCVAWVKLENQWSCLKIISWVLQYLNLWYPVGIAATKVIQQILINHYTTGSNWVEWNSNTAWANNWTITENYIWVCIFWNWDMRINCYTMGKVCSDVPWVTEVSWCFLIFCHRISYVVFRVSLFGSRVHF